MPKITRGGGPTNAAATLRALGKLGPYGQPAESTPQPEPSPEPAVVGWTADPEATSPWGSEAEVVDQPDAGAGAAVNVDTGVTTGPGEPLPEIAPEPDATPLEPDIDNAKVRAWAAANDIEVASRGKIPQHVIDRYLAAGEG